jgi:hypothetical protein
MRHAARQSFEDCRNRFGLLHDPSAGRHGVFDTPGKRPVSRFKRIEVFWKFHFDSLSHE